MSFKIESVNISREKGVQKHPVEEIECIEDYGIKGDAHAGRWHRQVSLLGAEAIETMKARSGDFEIKYGDFAENIVTRGMDWTRVQVGGKIVIDDVLLEVTQIGKECHSKCAIYDAVGECIMPTRGIFTRVIKGGKLHAGSSGYYSVG